jgi:hypothetical protein
VIIQYFSFFLGLIHISVDIVKASGLFPKLLLHPRYHHMIVSPFLFCSYQAVAYIEASAVIYQDGKVVIFF